MVLFPQKVDLKTASISQLIQLFTDSASDLQAQLQTLNGGTINKGSIATVRAAIQQRLSQLGVDVGSWITSTVPAQYIQGMTDAYHQQASFGQDIAAATIIGLLTKTAGALNTPVPSSIANISKPTIISPKQETFDLHTQSVQNIMDSMSTSFGTSITAMSRSADQTVSQIQALDIRRSIAQGASEGADTSNISKKITDIIKNNGISALTDASGKQWSPESYASMLTRTQLTTARNQGMMNAQTASGNDLVEVDSHGATDVCGDWEGEILSISGNDPNYSSVDDATAAGLFHPNCEHGLNAVDPDTYPSTVSVGASSSDDNSDE